jgi:hypothetical protein
MNSNLYCSFLWVLKGGLRMLLEQLQQLFKLISILSLYLHYSATLYLFFQTNSPTVLSISLSTLFKYTFLFFYLI